MSRILEALYFGNLNPNTELTPQSPQYLKAWEARDENEKALLSSLGEAERRKLLKLINACDEIITISSSEYFIGGFQLGAKVLWEVSGG